MTEKTFLRPTVDPTTGEPFHVYIPRKGREILPGGESLVVDAFLEKRISSGELERGTPETIVPETAPTGGRTRRTPQPETTTSTGA